MKIVPILASDTTGALIWVVIPFWLTVFGIGSAVVNAKWGRGTWWGLGLSLLPAVGGLAQMLFFLPIALIISGIACIPFLCGLLGVYLWTRERKV